MKKIVKLFLPLMLVMCLLLSACGKEESAPASTEEPEELAEVEEAVVEEPETTDYASIAKDALAEGNYHDALLTLLSWADEDPAASDTEAFDDILYTIADNTGIDEPQSGTELERTFQFQGGGLLTLKASSGPVEVTVVNVEDSSQYVRFYVREGESADINLPAAVYEISCKIGMLWFNSDIGFGDIYYDHSYDQTFDFSSSSDNAWITNVHWDITV